MKLSTEKPKLDKESWTSYIKSVVQPAASGLNIWHDNEKFLKQPSVYASGLNIRHDNEKFLKQPGVYSEQGLVMKNFPPNSGDLNPIENVWAALRKDLSR